MSWHLSLHCAINHDGASEVNLSGNHDLLSLAEFIHESDDEARCHKGSISGHRGDTCTTLWQQLFTIWSSTVTHHWLLLSSHPENFQNLLTISPLGLVIILRSRRLWSCLICTPLGYGRKLLRWLDSCKVILKSSSLLIIWVDLWKYVKL